MRRYKAATVGQSNEEGAGETASRNAGFGAPMKDPVGPRGSTMRSMWPRLANLMGDQGVWLDIHNTAVGATSLAVCWVGQIKSWAASQVVGLGQYTVGSGRLYKCTTATLSAPTIGLTAGVEPTWPASGTVVDGSVTWTYVRAATGADTNRKLFADGDAQFDPNGYVAAAYAGLSSALGYDAKWLFLSIGQSDKTLGTVRAEFAQSYINMADYFLARSVKCALGFTCSGLTAGLEDWYQAELLPGYADALANYAGNSNVIAGANLREALGVLAVQSEPQSPVPGLRADLLHMNDAAYSLASAAWRDALIAGGL